MAINEELEAKLKDPEELGNPDDGTQMFVAMMLCTDEYLIQILRNVAGILASRLVGDPATVSSEVYIKGIKDVFRLSEESVDATDWSTEE